MRIVFLRDYRGKLTNEVFYTEGTVVDLPTGEAIVAEGAAAPAAPPKVVRKPAKATAKKPTTRKPRTTKKPKAK